MRVFVLIFALLFAVILPAAAPPRAKTAPATSDASIEQNIRARFAKSKIAEDKFTVRVQGGVAIVEGTTSIIQRKGVATRLAKAGGAKSVDNRVRIADAARAKAVEKLHESTTRKTVPPAPRSAVPATAKPADPAPATAQPQAVPRAEVKH
jgi:hypothetical protein